MRLRLIPWCLAATAFVVALTVITSQGGPVTPTQPLQFQAAPSAPPALAAVPDRSFPTLQSPFASAAREDMPPLLVLPLPPASQPEIYPDIQPVPDDEPAVQDLPVQRGQPDAPEAE